jgi:hypothetical protein
MVDLLFTLITLALNPGKGIQRMPALLIQSTPGSPFGLLLLQVNDWCHEHHIKPIKLTYQIVDPSKICVEFHLDAEADAFALTFPGGAKFDVCHSLDFSV